MGEKHGHVPDKMRTAIQPTRIVKDAPIFMNQLSDEVCVRVGQKVLRE